jgi:hypothetical protein
MQHATDLTLGRRVERKEVKTERRQMTTLSDKRIGESVKREGEREVKNSVP